MGISYQSLVTHVVRRMEGGNPGSTPSFIGSERPSGCKARLRATRPDSNLASARVWCPVLSSTTMNSRPHHVADCQCSNLLCTLG